MNVNMYYYSINKYNAISNFYFMYDRNDIAITDVHQLA